MKACGLEYFHRFLPVPAGIKRIISVSLYDFNTKKMKFDELGLHEGIMEGIETMNFKEMTPFRNKLFPLFSKERSDRLRSDRHRQNGRLYASVVGPVCCTRTIRTMW